MQAPPSGVHTCRASRQRPECLKTRGSGEPEACAATTQLPGWQPHTLIQHIDSSPVAEHEVTQWVSRCSAQTRAAGSFLVGLTCKCPWYLLASLSLSELGQQVPRMGLCTLLLQLSAMQQTTVYSTTSPYSGHHTAKNTHLVGVSWHRAVSKRGWLLSWPRRCLAAACRVAAVRHLPAICCAPGGRSLCCATCLAEGRADAGAIGGHLLCTL